MHQTLAGVSIESASQRLAVDGDMLARQHRTPFGQHGGELIRIDSHEHIAEGIVGRCAIFQRKKMAQPVEPIASEGGHGAKITETAYHRAQSAAENIGELVFDGSGLAMIVDLREAFVKPSEGGVVGVRERRFIHPGP